MKTKLEKCKGIRMMLLVTMLLIPFMAYAEVKTYNGMKYDTNGYGEVKIMGLADDNLNATEINIPATIDGKSVTYIGGFQDTKLQRVVFNVNLSITIGLCCFLNCEDLMTVNFNGCCARIGESAFEGCKRLSSILDGRDIEFIDDYAFYKCESLGGFTIYKNLRNLGNYCFAESGLASIEVYSTLHEDLTVGIIKDRFQYYRSFGTGIGDYIFMNTKMTGIPSKFTFLTTGMYSGCVNFKKYTIPSDVTTLPEACFRGTGITSLTVPSNITELPQNVFSDTPIQTLTINSPEISKATTGGYSSYMESRFGKNVKTLTFGDACRRIGEYWAMGAENLKTVNLPKPYGLIIEMKAFCACHNLTSDINLVDATIGKEAFSSSGVKNVILTGGMVKTHAFSGTSLSNLELYDVAFWDYALTYCKTEDLTAGAGSTIRSTTVFKDLEITGALRLKYFTSVGENSFEGKKLKSVYFDKSIENINAAAFRGCKNLSQILFEARTDNSAKTIIHEEAFADCKELLSMTLENHFQVKENGFRDSFVDADLTLGGLNNFEKGAFNGCKFRFINVLDVEPNSKCLQDTEVRNVNFENATRIACEDILKNSTVHTLYGPKLHEITQDAIGYTPNLTVFGLMDNGYIKSAVGFDGCVYSSDDKTLLFICPGRSEVALTSKCEKIDLRGTDFMGVGDAVVRGIPVIDARAITDHDVTLLNDDGTRALCNMIRVATGARKHFKAIENIKYTWKSTLVQDYIEGDVNDDGDVTGADVLNVYLKINE